MYDWLNLKSIKCYLIKLTTDFYCQPRYLLSERSPFIFEMQKTWNYLMNYACKAHTHNQRTYFRKVWLSVGTPQATFLLFSIFLFSSIILKFQNYFELSNEQSTLSMSPHPKDQVFREFNQSADTPWCWCAECVYFSIPLFAQFVFEMPNA